MRLRRVAVDASDGSAATTTAVFDEGRGRWVPLRAAVERAGGGFADVVVDDVVATLAGGEAERERIARLLEAVRGEDFAEGGDPGMLLPFAPRQLRAFANSRTHWEQAARGLVRTFMPRAYPFVRGFERVTRRTFPPFVPKSQFDVDPAFYIGNALSIQPDGAEIEWPSYTEYLDFELELAAVVVHPLHDATPQQARDAVGGFVVFNDFSARDAQWDEVRNGLFGPVIKAKSFASAMSAEVVSADEILPHLRELAGAVRVNGRTWTTTSTAEQRWSFEEMAAYASRGERVQPGELLSAGTLPDGCGLELGRWLAPGDTIELSIDRVGTLTNTIGPRRSAPHD
jgi:2-keto-4-pentenoate hydratase/2-oxohepta-3-ene-1,7-dioic acid hydratase in catechol pathway